MILCPEFFTSEIKPPSKLYKDRSNKTTHFNDEFGIDSYMMLYAITIKKRNCDEVNDLRNKLGPILQKFNRLSAELMHGGSFYSHMQVRNDAFLEYFLHLQCTEKLEIPFNTTNEKSRLRKNFKKIIISEIAKDRQDSEIGENYIKEQSQHAELAFDSLLNELETPLEIKIFEEVYHIYF
jgi:hypothetical protein